MMPEKSNSLYELYVSTCIHCTDYENWPLHIYLKVEVEAFTSATWDLQLKCLRFAVVHNLRFIVEVFHTVYLLQSKL